MIYGNTDGIRNTILDELEKVYDINVQKQDIIDKTLVEIITDISIKINREISVAIDRRGKVTAIAMGDSSTVELPEVDVKERRLSGIRIIHTHPSGNSNLSAVDVSALIRMKLDAMVAVGKKEDGTYDFGIGFCALKDGNLVYDLYNNVSLEKLLKVNLIDLLREIEENFSALLETEQNIEKAVLVGCDTEESLEELAELADACNVKVEEKIFQKRNKIDTAYYIGSGKANEVALSAQAVSANLIIFDDELSPAQVKNLELVTGQKVIDRTGLILEIFARRARTKEAILQVELAQLKYRLPRLTGFGAMLSRTGGGIGTRGPGEKKLETDKRHIKERIYDLLSELKKIKKTRSVQREKRLESNIPVVSLIGYTNAGKSTLRNKLCEICAPKDCINKEDVFEADMLFATLDTTTRAVVLPNNDTITLTDTVGFVRKLPHDLVEAFKSTLEEVIYSNLLVHVVDASNEEVYEQIKAVEEVIRQLGVTDTPMILALNKVDKISEEKLQEILQSINEILTYEYKETVCISAKKEINTNLLIESIMKVIGQNEIEIKCLIPYSESSIHAYIHRNGNILSEEYNDNGYLICARVDNEVFNKTKNFHIE